jgi:hypothetical protein
MSHSQRPKKGASFTGYSMRQQPRFPKSASAKETQCTFAPIPKETRQYIYPESGFEARYERMLIRYDVKKRLLL